MSIARDLDTAAHRIARAERTVPAVLDHLDELRARVGSNERASGSRGSGVSDPTARLAAELAHIDVARRRIAEGAVLVLRAIDHLEQQCRQALGSPRAAEGVSTCPGWPIEVDDDGIRVEWCGDITAHKLMPETRDVVLRDDRLCARCGKDSDMADRVERRARERARMERQRYYAREAGL